MTQNEHLKILLQNQANPRNQSIDISLKMPDNPRLSYVFRWKHKLINPFGFGQM